MLRQRDCEKIRAEYPKGTQIELVEIGGEERMQPGLKGVVDMVDDMGQIHVVWENGSSLALNTGEDTFRIVEQEWKPYEKKMAAFLDRMYETLGNTDLVALNRSVNGSDTTLAHETLQKMQEAFEEVYGEEPMAWSEEYILAPAVFKGRESQVNALGLWFWIYSRQESIAEASFLRRKESYNKMRLQIIRTLPNILKRILILMNTGTHRQWNMISIWILRTYRRMYRNWPGSCFRTSIREVLT